MLFEGSAQSRFGKQCRDRCGSIHSIERLIVDTACGLAQSSDFVISTADLRTWVVAKAARCEKGVPVQVTLTC